jgi:hypothetical protein
MNPIKCMECMECMECMTPRRGGLQVLGCGVRKMSEPQGFTNLYRYAIANGAIEKRKGGRPRVPEHLKIKNERIPRETHSSRTSFLLQAKWDYGYIDILDEPLTCRSWLPDKTADKFRQADLKDSTELSVERQKELDYTIIRNKMIRRFAYMEPFLVDQEQIEKELNGDDDDEQTETES